MIHDDEPKGTVLSRREALAKAGAAGILAALGVGAVARPQDSAAQTKAFVVASPELTKGPFFSDDRLSRSDLVAGTDRKAVVEGEPVEVRIRVWELDGKEGRPLAGATVDLWHCDAGGVYSDEPDGGGGEDTRGQTWLRGYQVSDAEGRVKFDTVWPGRYPGRTVHFHVMVRAPKGGDTYEFASQIFFDEALNDEVMALPAYAPSRPRETRNRNDGIFRARQMDGSMAGDHLTARVSRRADGRRLAEFDVAFDMGEAD
jgi:protocatechuate 3,4-dioxygenase beta subunit